MEPKPSICIIDQSYYDFDARVRRKAEALVAAGYSVDVLCLRYTDRPPQYTLNGVNVYTLSLGKKRGSLVRYALEYLAFFLWVLVRVPLMMRRKHYSVVDVNTLPDFLIFAPVIARWMGAKLLLDMHEITPEFYMSKYGIPEGSWVVGLLKRIEKWSFDFADHVTTINEPIQSLFARRGLSLSKSTVIMNVADEARFAKQETSTPEGGDRFVMMYHGTLTSIYGLDMAIEAFDRARSRMPAAEFWILGLGPEEDALSKLIDARGLAASVRMIGQVSSADVPAWLSRCDAGLLPMRRDVMLDYAFPNKLAEYIVMGKPVLVPRLTSLAHYFSDQALAYFEPNDPIDLAKQMVRLYRDRQLRTRIAAKGAEEYAPIRWDVMRQRYLHVIDTLAGTQPAGKRAPSTESTVLAR